MSLHTNNRYAKKRGIAKTRYLQSVLLCVRNKLVWLLVTSTVLRGDRKAVRTNSATARSRKRSPTRTYQSQTAPRRSGVQETFQENGPTYVDSSSRRIQTVSGTYAATVRSKSIRFDPPTTVATTSLGSTFHKPTLGCSTIAVLATLSASSKTGDKARKEATLMTTYDHSLVQTCHPYDNAWYPWAAAPIRVFEE